MPDSHPHPDFIETAITFEDVEILIGVKLSVAPRHLLAALGKSTTMPLVREKANAELLIHLTHDMRNWRFVRVTKRTNLSGAHPDQASASTHPDGTAPNLGGGK